jgi:tetrahydromethanopterin S-methyltransferase subunit F
MSGWSIAGIAIGVLVAGVVLVSLPDILRYQRIRRM